MHERSLVLQLIEQVTRESEQRGLASIREVHVQIGEFAGVEPRLMELAFEEIAVTKWPHQVELILETVPLTAQCRQCDLKFLVESFRFVCPDCGVRDVQIISGEELQLVSLVATRAADQMEVTE